MPSSSLPRTDPTTIPAPQPQPSLLKWLIILGMLIFITFGSILVWVLPSFKTILIDTSGEPTLVWGGKEKLGSVVRREDHLYFHVPMLQTLLDPYIFWDQAAGYLAVTTKDQFIQMNSSQLTWYINQEPIDLRFPLLMIDGEPYLELEPLQSLYQLNISYIPDTNRVIVNKLQTPIINGKVIGAKNLLRITNSFRSPRLAKLDQGEQVAIIEEQDNWLKVQTNQGLIGYLPEKQIVLQDVSFTSILPPLEKPPWKPLGGKINLVWEQVTQSFRNPKLEVITSLEGVNAYSPTWFHLADVQGNITNYADPEIINKAHQEGKQVWALFSNSFDPTMTSQFLQDPIARDRAIRQLVVLARLYHLDGINIDFENTPSENKELLVQFIRELAPMLREQDLVVSMDVTFKSNSSNWSLIYDREALGKAVDYLIVMAYDEHWATSPVPGSVASLPWVEKGLLKLLEEVPSEKILLGLPLYARLWTVYQTNDTASIASKALSMHQSQKWITENQLQPTMDPATGQHFAELKQDGKHYLLWLEDETSIQKRVELVHKYGLAGVAAWQRGFAKEELWPSLANYLE